MPGPNARRRVVLSGSSSESSPSDPDPPPEPSGMTTAGKWSVMYFAAPGGAPIPADGSLTEGDLAMMEGLYSEHDY